ncbi:hypothetical protein [Myxococcus stipitatus]|uniref:hypothetical protein n=1 Tax=Myxococcus stipitatus TaxID=83455 RepID=UPI0030D343DE
MKEPVASYTEEQVGNIIRAHIEKEFLFRSRGPALGEDNSLITRGIIDSIGIFRMVNFLEQRFEIAIAPSDISMENFCSLRAIRTLTLSRMHGRGERESA